LETINLYHIQKVRGIDIVLGGKLKQIGIETTEDLLARTAKPEDRKALAEKIGVSPELVLEWANRADLLRIDGMDQDYSDLLEVARVDTMVELSKRVPENLLKTLIEVNKEKKVAYKFAYFLKYPKLEEVQHWIEQAKAMPRKLVY